MNFEQRVHFAAMERARRRRITRRRAEAGVWLGIVLCVGVLIECAVRLVIALLDVLQ